MELKIECTVSDTGFDHKPEGKDFNRITWSVQRLTPEEIAERFSEGYAVYPCRKKKEWCQGRPAQMVVFDIDESKLTPDEFCGLLNLKPTIVYSTFSSTDNEYRFRLVYVFDRPFPSERYGQVYDIIYGMEPALKLVGNDTHSRNPYQLVFGTDKGVDFTGIIHRVPNDVPIFNGFFGGDDVDCDNNEKFDIQKDFKNMGMQDFLEKYSRVYGGVISYETFLTPDKNDERIVSCKGNYYCISVPWCGGKPCLWRSPGRHSMLFVAGVKWRHIYGNCVDNGFMLYLIVRAYWRHCEKTDFGTRTGSVKGDLSLLVKEIMAADLNCVKPDGIDKWRVNLAYCRENDIPTKGLLQIIRNEKSAKKRGEKKLDKYNEYDKYYDSKLSLRKNVEVIKSHGIEVSLGTLQRYVNNLKTKKL